MARPDHDPAFVWDDPAAPPGRRRDTVPTPPPSPASPPAARSSRPARRDEGRPRWVTLREAAEATGIPLSTVGSWARKGRVPSRLEQRAAGPRRTVDPAAVAALAAARGGRRASPERESPPSPSAPSRIPDGHLLVPRDAWEKMLAQLGNLHEAGRELAEARERAAKAETEAAFLRERLAETRARAAGENASPPPEAATRRRSWWSRLSNRD